MNCTKFRALKSHKKLSLSLFQADINHSFFLTFINIFFTAEFFKKYKNYSYVDFFYYFFVRLALSFTLISVFLICLVYSINVHMFVMFMTHYYKVLGIKKNSIKLSAPSINSVPHEHCHITVTETYYSTPARSPFL